ncbi:hypothetical protein Fot_31913 [Forsythia ovata]|uniref:Uncharacterized protein n=1 Tax=Forsythia ovata TaxID=205694 RepID=A0ABD1T6A1_9LAMI
MPQLRDGRPLPKRGHATTKKRTHARWNAYRIEHQIHPTPNIPAHQGDTYLHPRDGRVSGPEYLSVVTVGYHVCGKSSGITTYFQTGQLSSSRKVVDTLCRSKYYVEPPTFWSLNIWALCVKCQAGLSTL